MDHMGSRWIPGDDYSSRSRSAWFFAGVGYVAGGGLAASGLAPVTRATPALLATGLAIAVFSHVYFWRPHVRVRPSAVTVVNSWRSHRVPWAALLDVQTRFDLTLITTRGEIHARGAPSPGGLTSLRAGGAGSREALQGGPSLPGVSYGPRGTLRAGDRPDSDSGGVARVIRGHWQMLVDSDALDETDAVVDSRVEAGAVAACAVVAVLALLGWLAPGLAG